MDIGVAIVVSVAIASFCAMITILGVFGMKYGEKFLKECKKKKDEK